MVDSRPKQTHKTAQIEDATLVCGDAISGMEQLETNSFDLAIVDPPYGASTKAQWKLPKDHNLKSFGGAWQLADHEWDMLQGLRGFRFLLAWLAQLQRLIKPSGSIWIHSTYHNSGMANVACQLLGLEIINEVVWFKRNAFPNLSKSRLTASHETILWVHTGKSKRQYRFNYDDVKAASFNGDNLKQPGKQLRTVWDVPNNKDKSELAHGKHPTQKPLRLISRMFMISGKPGGNVLIPFIGNGSEMVGALQYGMNPYGFEIDETYFDMACKRVKQQVETRTHNTHDFFA